MRRRRSWLLPALAILAGLLVGDAIAATFPELPVLARSFQFRLEPQTLALPGIVSVTVGFSLRAAVAGAILAVLACLAVQGRS